MSASVQGEVHAPSAAPGAESNPYARLPEYRPDSAGLPPDPELLREREEIRWEPGMTLDGDLLMYLRAARSMAAFAGMCDGGSADDGHIAASRDDTTINALDVLHDSGYNPGKALQALVKCPAPRGIDKKWCEEETKRFVKGLRQFGKNFFRIRKDLLPHKETPELVEYYYLWKKTPGANNNRPHRRRRAGSLRRARTTRSTRSGTPKEEQVDESAGVVPAAGARPSPNPKESGDENSGSDDENEDEDDSDSRDRENSDQCHHCMQRTTDLAPGGTKERSLLCSDCRAYFKKSGELPPLPSKGSGDAPYLFRPVQTDSPDGSPSRMRTRNKNANSANESGSRSGRPKRSGTSTPDSELEKKTGCKSPGASSSNSGSGSPSEKAKKKKLETPTKGKKRPQLDLDGEEERENALKRKKNERAESPSEDLTTDSGSVADDAENNDNEVDGGETNSDMLDSKASVKLEAESKPIIKLEDVKPILGDSKPDHPLKIEDLKDPGLLCLKKEDGMMGTMNVGITVMPVSTSTESPCKDEPPSLVKLEGGGSRSEEGSAQFNSQGQLPNSVTGPIPSPLTGHNPLPASLSGQISSPLTGQVPSVISGSVMALSMAAHTTQLNGQPTQQQQQHTSQSQQSGQRSGQPSQGQQQQQQQQPPQQSSQQSGQPSQQAGQHPSGPAGGPPGGPPGPPPGPQGSQGPTSQAIQIPNSPGQADGNGKPSSNGAPPQDTSKGPGSVGPPGGSASSSDGEKSAPATPSGVLPPMSSSQQSSPGSAPASESNVDGQVAPSEPLRHGPDVEKAVDDKEKLTGLLSVRPPHPGLVTGSGGPVPPGFPYLTPQQQAQYQQYLQQQWGSATTPTLPLPLPHPSAMSASVTAPSSAPGINSTTLSTSVSGTLPSVSIPPSSLTAGSIPPGAMPPGAIPHGALPHALLPPNIIPGISNAIGAQSEPQNLKIKQEITTPTDSLPPDPLQSLKDVKVPGYTGPPLATLDSIKTEQPDPVPQAAVAPPPKTPPNKPRSVTPTDPSRPVNTPPSLPRAPSTHTPPNPPTSIPQPVMHPSQQPSPLNRISPGHHLAHPHPHPFVSPMHHPHHPLMSHHPLLTALHNAGVPHPYAHPHAHPYAGYPYPFPYPYAAIPQPVPPPSRIHEPPKPPTPRDGYPGEGSSMLSAHALSRRETNAADEGPPENNPPHHATSLSAHNKLALSHSSSSSQHKSAKRSGSPGGPPTPVSHASVTLPQSTAASISASGSHGAHHHHQHQHQHQHQHMHSAPSPGGGGPGSAPGGASSGAKMLHPLAPHHGHGHAHPVPAHAGLPGLGGHPNHPGHPGHPGYPPLPGSSLDALRAHAQAAASMQQHRHEDGLKPEEVDHGEDEEVPSPTHIPRGPSPEPKIEDTECHRSQSAIFLRHWNRGDFNSCCRTDLTFKPVPDSKLARKREEKLRKQAEKEREEREKAEARKNATPEKADGKPPSRGAIENVTPPYDRFGPRPGYPDTPALRTLSEYARPHSGFSPGALQRSNALGIPPHCMDSIMQYQLNIYGPGARERLELEELERQKRDREMRELRERELNDRLKEELMKNAAAGAAPRLAGQLDPHWLELHRRYASLGAGGPPQGPASLHQFGLYQPQGPGGLPGSLSSSLNQLERERLERLASAGYPRPSLLPPREAAMAMHHPSDLLGRPYADQLVHQVAHEQLQRQMMMERDRFPHPSLVAHEEYLRQQRERELKVRALEEAARGSRQ